MRSASVLLLAATLSAATFADQLYVTLTGMDTNHSTTIDLRVFDPATSHYAVWSGIQAGGILAIAGNSPVEDFFCVDLFHDISVPGTYLDDRSLPNALLHQDRAAWMIDNILPTLSANAAIARVQGAALQVAIWDVIHDNGDGLAAGIVQKASTTNAGVISWAEQYIAASLGKSAMDVGVYKVTTLDAHGAPYQTLMGDTMVPEPASAGFLVAGIALLMLARGRQVLAAVNPWRNTARRPVPGRLS